MRTLTTLLLTLLVASASAQAAGGDSCLFTAGSFTDGNPDNDNFFWDNPANWSCAHAPGPGDTATLTVFSVTLRGSAAVGTLNLWGNGSAGNLSLIGNPTLSTGALDWRHGDVEGAGTVVVHDAMALTGASLKRLRSAATLRLDGTGTWQGEGDLRLELGAVFHINGTFDVQTDADIVTAGDASLVNAGTLQKTGGAGATDVFVPITNTGTLEVQTGALRLRNGGALNGGAYVTVPGTSLTFTAGVFRVAGTFASEAGGYMEMRSVDGLGAPTFEAAGAGARLDITGTGLRWFGGVFTSAGGTWTNEGIVVIGDGSSKNLSASFTNEGEIFAQSAEVVVEDGATFENAPGAAIELLYANAFIQSGAGRFVNRGLVRKTGTGLVDFDRDASGQGGFFENRPGGVVVVEEGILGFSGGFDHRDGAEVRGTATFAPGTPFNLRDAGGARGGSPVFAGDVSPGRYGGGTGVLTWFGSYRPTNASTLNIDLGGPRPGEHDQVVVDGPIAWLRGTLDLRLAGGYTPTIGKAFTVLMAPAIGGAFSAVNAPPGYAFDVSYSETSVVATVTGVPPVTAAMAPESPPVVIPAGGGPFAYRVRLTNATPQPQSVQAWTEAMLPNGNTYGPVEGPVTLRLNPGQTLGPLALQLRVPGTAPAGTYTYRLRVGRYPNVVVSEASFTFQKQGTALADGEPLAFSGSGFSAASEAWAPSEAPTGYALHAAAPNPFSTRATLQYSLPEAGPVRLVVYDLLGREVVVLADGEAAQGRHEAVLDGRGLAAGVYVVRMTAGAEAFTRRVTLAR